jgi:hypothetical protein
MNDIFLNQEPESTAASLTRNSTLNLLATVKLLVESD